MSKLHKAQTAQGHSKVFFEFIRGIGEAKSKQEEDKIVLADLSVLKQAMGDKGIDKKTMKECVIRMLYCEMLGHQAEFGYIHAVNLASSTDLLFKRVGYLGTWLCINPEHEFMYLIVSNLQRDMKSANFLDVAAAATACSKLLRPELMTCINADVVNLLQHTNPLVRKKAVLCMEAFYRKSDGLVGDQKNFRTALCDKDPSVMGASLCLFHDVASADPKSCKELIPSFLSILKQITEHRLSREYDYHRVPAPWMQIKLLKLIAVLAADDQVASERSADLLLEVMKRADTGLNIGHAVIFEAITTITSICPIPALIETAADAISKFLTSNNANMKYLGITALSRIVKIDPKYAQEHQHIVLDCLEDSDDTIRRKTLTLLFAMCNENNVEAIVARILRFLGDATDQFIRKELTENLCDVAERFMPSNEWYVETMNRLLEMAPEHVSQTTIQGMLKIIAEGDGEDEAEDAAFRTRCSDSYMTMLDNPEKLLSSQLNQVCAWVIGEYGFLSKKFSRMMMIDRLCDLLERVRDSETRGWIVTSLMKLVAHSGAMPDNVEDLVIKLKDSQSVSLQQRCYEFHVLSSMLPVLKKVCPLDGCCEDIEVDENLSFLDDIVNEALKNGARPYMKKESKVEEAGLRTEAYKSAQVNIVDEEELTAEKFNEDAGTEKLIIKESVKRWGVENLKQELAVEQNPDIVEREGVSTPPAEDPYGAEAPSSAVADNVPQTTAARKQTRNEKFMSDIFAGGSGGKKTTKRRGGARAQEAQRRAQEAESATRDMPRQQAAHAVAPQASAPLQMLAPAQTAVAPAVPMQKPAAAGPSPKAEAPQVQLNVQKQMGPDCLRLRVGILSNAALSRAILSLEPPKKLTIELRSSIPNAEVRENVVNIPLVPAGQPAFVEAQLKATDFPATWALGISLSFGSDTGPGSARLSHPIVPSDFLRQVQATTEMFGGNWKQHLQETKVQLRFPKNITPDGLGQHIGERANLRIIQIIGKECIAAARLAPVGHWLLTHIAVDGANANTTIRSNSKDFSDHVAKALASGL